jgi:hypothetical protein
MDLCVFESEECEYGVGTGVNVIIMSDVLYGMGLAESSFSVLPYLDITVSVFPNFFVCY